MEQTNNNDKIHAEYITEKELLKLDIQTLRKLSQERKSRGEKVK